MVARSCWLLLLLGSLVCAPAQTSIQTILTNGPVLNRFNIVVLSEGYTADQLPQFRSDAANAIAALLAHAPYREYQSYVNAFAISVPSVQSGSDHPAEGVYRNTYFNSSYSGNLITMPTNSAGQGKVDALLKRYLPQCHLAILLVNEPFYDGGSDNFARTAIASISPMSSEILAHETGHVVAGLGDEYTDPYPGFPDLEEPNTTRETRPNFIKWKAWIPTNTPTPTPDTYDYSMVVGLFRGAHYHTANWYRPKLDCAMRSLGVPFCEVCSEALVLSVYKKVRPVDACFPVATNLSVTTTQALSFEVSLLQPDTHNLTVRWQLDGAPLEGATDSAITLLPLSISNGVHKIAAVVKDETLLVRNDPKHVLSQTVTWTLNVTHSQPGLGTYRGLFADTANGISPQSAGAIALTATANRKFSGSLLLGAARYTLVGQFDTSGNAQLSIRRGLLAPLSVQLQVDPADSDHLTGSVSDSTFNASLSADRAVYDSRFNPAPQAGRYTLIVPGNYGSAAQPGGDSFGVLTVSKAGLLQFAGALADGLNVSQATMVSKNGQWPLYLPLYGGKGLLYGWLDFGSSAASDLSGPVTWIRPAMPGAKMYAGGFTSQTTAAGSRYSPPAAGVSILNMPTGQVTLSGASLDQNIVNQIALGTNNRVTNLSSNLLNLAFALPAGTFRGGVVNPQTAKAVPFRGVVLQKQNIASGFFMSTDQSGDVMIAAPVP